ncbi:hypothetical protein PV08_02542 [Exophiala spinifera]|uniref:Uncharacterized protein n=1 Tax=Exophiala spinifera TaxID=91928 RepID=A0A0D2C3N6_9EURO|nr:uncharacterized protein PV08_02542 [Exophiala spinifera]KIW18254.1 hypothetical protein PV08_02542 [Exophiala spinifera]
MSNPERQEVQSDMEGQYCQRIWQKEVHNIPFVQSCDNHTNQIQRCVRSRDVQLNIVELGEVREGGIARRRASNSRLTTDQENGPGVPHQAGTPQQSEFFMIQCEPFDSTTIRKSNTMSGVNSP